MNIKKMYIDAVKDTLKCYRLLEGHKTYLEEQLKDLKFSDGIRSSELSMKVSTSNINKLTENTALQNIDDEKELIQEIHEYNKKIQIIDSAISKLDDFTKEVLRLKMKTKMQWLEIADELNYSERHCKYKYKEALESLAIVFYGDKAIDKSELSKVG